MEIFFAFFFFLLNESKHVMYYSNTKVWWDGCSYGCDVSAPFTSNWSKLYQVCFRAREKDLAASNGKKAVFHTNIKPDVLFDVTLIPVKIT